MDPVTVLLELEKRFRDLPDPRRQLRATYHGTRTGHLAQSWDDFKKAFREGPDAYAYLLTAAKNIEATLTELVQERAHVEEYVARWSVTAGVDRHADPRLVERFCSEAARAARVAGLIDAGATIPEAVDAWLDAVAAYLRPNGDHVHAIEDLAAISADVCARLAAEAVMSTRAAPSRHAGETERTGSEASDEAGADAAAFDADGRTSNRKRLEAYIDEVREKTGKELTKSQIAKWLGYEGLTALGRWERHAPNVSHRATMKIEGMLKNKPHLSNSRR